MFEKGDIVVFKIGGGSIQIGVLTRYLIRQIAVLIVNNEEFPVHTDWFVEIPKELRKEPIEVVKLYLAL